MAGVKTKAKAKEKRSAAHHKPKSHGKIAKIAWRTNAQYSRQAGPAIRDLDDAMLYSILTGSQTRSVSRLSLELVSAISAMASNTLDLDYKHGIRIGRKLFNMVSSAKQYSWYGEAIPDLVNFMEKAGYGAVTYKIFPFSISVRVHQDSHNISTKAHTFEAGMISGFLTAAKGQLVNVNESMCASDGADYCDFVTSDSRLIEPRTASSEMVYRALQEAQAVPPELKREYYALATSGVSGEHINALGDAAFSMGAEIGHRIARRESGSPTESVLKVIKAAYPCAVSVKRISPTNVKVSFDQMSSRKGVVELMRRFVEGVLSSALGVEVFKDSISAAKGNSYSMTVKIK